MTGAAARNDGRLTRVAAVAVGSGMMMALAPAQARSINHAELERLFGEPVTTSVTGKPQRASEVGASLVIITRDDIRRSPANDIAGLLRDHAGVIVNRWTAGQSDVAIRGGVQTYNPRLLVLVNGRQAYLDHYGMTNWSGLGVQLEEVQQIEVVKGPNSALFGFNAAAGVVNIITVDPRQSEEATASAEIGDDGYRRVAAAAATRLGAAGGLRFSAGYRQVDELAQAGAADIAMLNSFSGPDHHEVASELYVRPDERTEARLSASYSRSDQLEMPGLPALSEQSFAAWSFDARVTRDTDRGALGAHLTYNKLDADYVISDTGPPRYVLENQTLVVGGHALVRLGRESIGRLGVEYRRNELENRSGYLDAIVYDVFAANGMWDMAISDSARLTLASRIDHLKLGQRGNVNQPTIFTTADFDRSLTTWSANGSLLLSLTEESRLHLAAGRGVQSPSLVNFGMRLTFDLPYAPVPFIIAGDPGIRPTKVWSGEIGYSHDFGSGRAKLAATAFYSRTSDVIALPASLEVARAMPPAVPFIFATVENVGRFESYGIELSAEGRLGAALRWGANYTLIKTDEQIPGVERPRPLWGVMFDRSTPEHMVKMRLAYERGRWLASAQTRYVSGTTMLAIGRARMSQRFPIDESIAVDVKLAFGLTPAMTLSLAGENLTGAAGADLSPLASERRVRAGLTVELW